MRAVIQRVTYGSVCVRKNFDILAKESVTANNNRISRMHFNLRKGLYPCIKSLKLKVREKYAKILIESIGKGFVVLIGIEKGDNIKDVEYIADKITNLRIFEDENGKMNLSIKEVDGQILLISQFTLLGDARKGRRPNFMTAANPDEANKLFEVLFQNLQNRGICAKKGVFGAHMIVNIQNDGPVTILLDSKKIF